MNVDTILRISRVISALFCLFIGIAFTFATMISGNLFLLIFGILLLSFSVYSIHTNKTAHSGIGLLMNGICLILLPTIQCWLETMLYVNYPDANKCAADFFSLGFNILLVIGIIALIVGLLSTYKFKKLKVFIIVIPILIVIFILLFGQYQLTENQNNLNSRLEQKAFETGNSALCENMHFFPNPIKGSYWRDYCYIQQAKKAKNVALCENIKSNYLYFPVNGIGLKNVCYAEIAAIYKDEKKCEKIIAGKQTCVEYVRKVINKELTDWNINADPRYRERWL